MATNTSSLKTWSNYELFIKEDDPFSYLTQLPSLDFSENGFSSILDWQNEYYPLEESCFDAIPLMESFPEPINEPLDIVPIQRSSNINCDISCGYVNGIGNWDELGPLLLEAAEKQSQNKEESREEKKVQRLKEDRITGSKMLSRETISHYFYLPITQAAKALNVGLTLLKKRCRELGIRRWPHRKLMSLQTLIKNVQELEKEGGEGSEGKLKHAIEILERERKLIEEVPDLKMEDNTRRLRQACFKANYKKRKLMENTYTCMDISHYCSSTPTPPPPTSSTIAYHDMTTGNHQHIMQIEPVPFVSDSSSSNQQ
ncbi:hypothetical protein ACOSP7_023786 [Xanthoceras sorbifolium]